MYILLKIIVFIEYIVYFLAQSLKHIEKYFVTFFEQSINEII